MDVKHGLLIYIINDKMEFLLGCEDIKALGFLLMYLDGLEASIVNSNNPRLPGSVEKILAFGLLCQM